MLGLILLVAVLAPVVYMGGYAFCKAVSCFIRDVF